ncbi:hypothetical protein LCGC14_2621660, partial [marine sediment metagenome]
VRGFNNDGSNSNDVRVNAIQMGSDFNDEVITTQGVTFNGEEYVPWGNYLFKLNGTYDGFTEIRGFVSAITSLKVANLYVNGDGEGGVTYGAPISPISCNIFK